jgi:hypothetical protein
VGQHDVVERPLHVEHRRIQAAAGGRVDAGDGARRVVQLAQTERLGQPAGGIDGQHDRLAPGLGGPQRERGRGRRLADPAGAAADDDLDRTVGQDGVDVEVGGLV